MKEISPLKVDSKCLNFKLKNQDGEICSLESVLKTHNAVLVYFYPRAMTPGCTVQACSLENSKMHFKKRKIAVLGISGDSVEKLKKFSIRDDLSFDLLSDEDHKVANQFGVWGKKVFMGKTKEGLHRISFLIGKNFKIIHVFQKVNTKTHHQDVLDYYDALSN